ncbi:acyl-ACP thioesterase domain-containing protein [Enterococcus sp. LJL90]
MAKKYTKEHEVTFYECDVNQQMTFPALLSVAVKVSEDQSALFNRGNEYIHQLGLGWVITNYQIAITRMPTVGEVCQVTTEAKEYNKFFCYRSFWFHDAAGNELVAIESVFVLMDMAARKVTSVPDEVIAPYESTKVKSIRRFPAIEKVETGKTLPFRVRFYDIDSNHHVNNSIYFNWMINALDYQFLVEHRPLSVNIRFDKEVEYGATVDSLVEVVEKEGQLLTRHEIRLGTELCCEANFIWEPIK